MAVRWLLVVAELFPLGGEFGSKLAVAKSLDVFDRDSRSAAAGWVGLLIRHGYTEKVE